MRRVIAALIGVVLALAGAFLVIRYASNADERAAANLETVPVVVAVAEIPVGTPVSEFGDRVEVRQIPRSATLDDAVSSLDDVESLVLAASTVPGEQLSRQRLVTSEELRARGEAELPEELADHHQVTLLLDKANALGGNIAPGDTVGVFMSFDIDTEEESADDTETGTETEDSDGRPLVAGGSSVSVTDLALHKVPVVRVEGAFVAAPVAQAEEQSDQAAEDRIFVTLALEPEDAARLVFAAEWGSVYLSYEPEGAPEDRVPTIVVTLPSRGEDVLQ